MRRGDKNISRMIFGLNPQGITRRRRRSRITCYNWVREEVKAGIELGFWLETEFAGKLPSRVKRIYYNLSRSGNILDTI